MSAVAKARALLAPAIFTLVGLAILSGLGFWQVERKAWKENLIATLEARLHATSTALPRREQWQTLNAARDEFERVAFRAQFLAGQDALIYTAGSSLRSDVSGPGYWVFTPARIPGVGTIVIDRGFVPQGRQDAIASPGESVDITGYLRWPEARGWFAPQDEPQHNLWFTRDLASIAAAKSWGDVAPFYVDMESPVPAGGFPRPGPLTVTLPNNHLGYAITWFGLALSLAVVFATWAWKRVQE